MKLHGRTASARVLEEPHWDTGLKETQIHAEVTVNALEQHSLGHKLLCEQCFSCSCQANSAALNAAVEVSMLCSVIMGGGTVWKLVGSGSVVLVSRLKSSMASMAL